jgi:AraC-like DNA-binding protein
MRYRERRPSAILQPFVECIWTLNGPAREVVAQPERILPDGCMELIFHRGKPFRRRGELQPHCFVVGQMIEPAFLQVSTRIEVVGIRFHPGGAYPFLMFPMHELTHRFISVAEVWGRLGRELEERVLGAPSTRQAVRMVLHDLERRLISADVGKNRAQGLASVQIQHHGTLSVRELAYEGGISERQLEREFNDVVGLAPKVFSRILRFQRVFEAFEQNAKWIDVALECGYSDQPHLIADFRQFAATTPTTFDLAQFELGRHFLRKSRMSGFSKTDSAPSS